MKTKKFFNRNIVDISIVSDLTIKAHRDLKTNDVLEAVARYKPKKKDYNRIWLVSCDLSIITTTPHEWLKKMYGIKRIKI